MSIWKKIKKFIEKVIDEIFGCNKSWDECTLSSNWHGSNASWRMMNMLSPLMPDAVYNERKNFLKSRGVNCVHLILCNKADGEYAGYSIYGNTWTGTVNKSFADVMLKRIKDLRSEGYGIVLWLTTDDSSDWNKKISSDPKKYVNDLYNLGFFEKASTVVIGLEADEYWSVTQCAEVAAALKEKYSGKTGVHQTSGKFNYAAVADIMFYQINPGASASKVASEASRVITCGKPVNFFELDRQENRELSKAAMDAGCFACGNY